MIAQLIISLIGGPVVNSLLKGYRASLDARNTSERIAADLAIKDIEAGIEARAHAKEVRMATAGFWEMRLLTFAIAFPFVSHLWEPSGIGTHRWRPLTPGVELFSR
jgi:hypothetical protein